MMDRRAKACDTYVKNPLILYNKYASKERGFVIDGYGIVITCFS